MTPEEQYPGLFEAFKDWHLSHCGDRVAWHKAWVSQDYEDFVAATRGICLFFSTNGDEVYHKYPPYLIALRDMSLV